MADIIKRWYVHLQSGFITDLSLNRWNPKQVLVQFTYDRETEILKDVRIIGDSTLKPEENHDMPILRQE